MPSLDTYEFGRGPVGGAYRLSDRAGMSAAFTPAVASVSSVAGVDEVPLSIAGVGRVDDGIPGETVPVPGTAFEESLEASYSHRGESEWLRTGDVLEDAAIEEVGKTGQVTIGARGKFTSRDCRVEMGSDDRDEIAQIEDPLDCLEENAATCGVYWYEESL